MLGRQTPPADPDPEDSGAISQFLQGLRDYFAARGELIALESREAAEFAGRKLAIGVVLMLCTFFGYCLLLTVLVFLLDLLFGAVLPPSLAPHSLLFSAALLGTLHFGIAFAAWRRLKTPPEQPLYEASRAELEKDRAWIKDQQSKSKNGN